MTGSLSSMFGILLILGMFMDQFSMMMLTVPIFFPLAQTLGFDLIWFAVIILLALEISFTTPPFGLLLFVMKGVAPPGTTMREIYMSAMPFMGCAILLVSVELDEILALADRIMVMNGGRITGIVDAGTADRERLGLMMSGYGSGQAS